MQPLTDLDFHWHIDEPDLPDKTADEMKAFLDAPIHTLVSAVNTLAGEVDESVQALQSELDTKQDTLIAGTNIEIDDDAYISARIEAMQNGGADFYSDQLYIHGVNYKDPDGEAAEFAEGYISASDIKEGLEKAGSAVQSVNDQSPEDGNVDLTGEDIPVAENYANTVKQEFDDVYDAISQKQDNLAAGENITIAGNVISANAEKYDPLTYEGANLTQKFAAEISGYSDEWAWIKARTQAGNFEGIHVKDYIPFTVTVDGVNYNYKARIAGINTYKGGYIWDGNAIGNHIDFISDELWHGARKINPVSFNNGWHVGDDGSDYPILCCDLYHFLNSTTGKVPNSTTQPPTTVEVDYSEDGVYYRLPQKIKSVIVGKKMLPIKKYSASGIISESNGISQTLVDIGKIWLPTEIEVAGRAICAKDIDDVCSQIQYPIFAEHKYLAKNRNGDPYPASWWMYSSPSKSDGWCCRKMYGYFGTQQTYDNLYFPICFRIA